jgi:hypothetical protein
MTDERKKAQSRADICTQINDLIIAGATWAQIASKLKEDEVYIRRGSHGAQKKVWTALSTYQYYRSSPSEMKLPEGDWPQPTPKEKKKATSKKAKKAPAVKKKAPKKTSKKAAPAKKRKAPEKAPPKRSVMRRSDRVRELRLREARPARLSIDITDEGAKISFNYRGEVTEDLQEVCTELLAIFNRLNGED